MNSAAPDLAVVIVSYNTRELLAECLESVAAELSHQPLRTEVCVVDNASSDGSAAMVAERFPWVRLLAEPKNLGFSGANNRCLAPWAAGSGCPRWTLLLNPDAALLPGTLATLLTAAEARPEVAVAGPGLVYADGSFQHGAFRWPGILQAALDLFPPPGGWGARLLESRLNGRYPRRLYRQGQPFRVEMVLGACMLVRGEALRQVGPLDEGYFLYAEELDWCRRFAQAGWQALCVPAATVLHHAGAASSQFRAWSWSTLWQSRRRYLRRFEPAWRTAAVEVLLRLSIARRRRADRRLLAAGQLDAAEVGEREAAYARALGPVPSPERASPGTSGPAISPSPSRFGGGGRGERAGGQRESAGGRSETAGDLRDSPGGRGESAGYPGDASP